MSGLNQLYEMVNRRIANAMNLPERIVRINLSNPQEFCL